VLILGAVSYLIYNSFFKFAPQNNKASHVINSASTENVHSEQNISKTDDKI